MCYWSVLGVPDWHKVAQICVSWRCPQSCNQWIIKVPLRKEELVAPFDWFWQVTENMFIRNCVHPITTDESVARNNSLFGIVKCQHAHEPQSTPPFDRTIPAISDLNERFGVFDYNSILSGSIWACYCFTNLILISGSQDQSNTSKDKRFTFAALISFDRCWCLCSLNLWWKSRVLHGSSWYAGACIASSASQKRT